MKNQNGFTLVEMFIAMTIALILVGITMTIYIVQAREVTESMAYSEMQRGYDLFLEEFGRDVRFANRILDSSEVFTFVKEPFPDGMTSSVIITYGRDGSIENQYSLVSDTILHNGMPFITGRGVLTVDADSSFFILSTFRDDAIVALKLINSNAKTDVAFRQRKGLFRCRN